MCNTSRDYELKWQLDLGVKRGIVKIKQDGKQATFQASAAK